MKLKIIATLLLSTFVGTGTAGAGNGQLQPETMPHWPSAKQDAYSIFRVSTTEVIKHFNDDKTRALAAAVESERGWKSELRGSFPADIAKRVDAAFAELRAAVPGDNILAFHIPRQVIDKSILNHVLPAMEAALTAKNVDEAKAWVQIHSTKFGWEKKPAEVVATINAAFASPDAAHIRMATLALHRHMAGETIAEVVNAPVHLEKKNSRSAQVVTTEGKVYFYGVQDDFARRMGKDEADRVLQTFDAVMAAAKGEDIEGAKKGADWIREALTKYQASVTQAMSSPGMK